MGAALTVDNLSIELATPSGRVEAVSGVSFSLAPGRALALVGESGAGKTLTALGLMGLLPPGARAVGRVDLDGRNWIGAGEEALEAIRGRRIAMTFQEPLPALNPVFTVGAQIADVARHHGRLSGAEAKARAEALLAQMGLTEARRIAASYPHQLSGGQRQRALLALALAGAPQVLIADEPTSALDSATRDDIVSLLARLKGEGLALLVVTHDLEVARRLCETTAVMYAGRIVEVGPTERLLSQPAHPYTAALVALDQALSGGAAGFSALEGHAPGVGQWPTGCRFRDRCERAQAACAESSPALAASGVACLFPLPWADAR